MKKIQIIGNIVRDAEVKTISQDKNVINFDVAVNETWKNKDGVKQEKTTYVKCAMWRQETGIAQYLTKGNKIYVDGNPDAEAYINKDGNAVASLTINVNEVIFLSPKKS
jgi:single-strand DNA-binding protein